jgi:DHA2 family multidrug resistance protein
MCLGFFIAYLDIQIVAASLHEIGGGLSASQDEIAWVQTSYLIAEIVVIPLSGWLSRVLSTHWLFAASAAGCTLASLLCATATDIQSMIAFRARRASRGSTIQPSLPYSSFSIDCAQRSWASCVACSDTRSCRRRLNTDTWSWQWLFT